MKSCAYCGAEMQRRTGESNTHWEKRRYCSIACRNRGYVKHGVRAWKSGRCDCDTCATAFQAAEANREANNDQASLGVAWVKRRGRTSPADWYVVMDGKTFMELLRKWHDGYVPF